ncbi:tetratricopeptide repeat protein [Parapedomonas caeni]
MATEDQGEAFLREVDEELRRDQLASIWSRYGRSLLVVIGLLLVALAGFLYWREWRAEQHDKQSDRLAAALAQLEAGDADKALPELRSLASDGSDGVATLARFAEAAQLIGVGKREEAAKAFQALADDKGIEPPFRQLASLRVIQLTYDSLTAEQAIARLKPLAQDGAPWFGPAGELLAATYLKNNQPELARPLFEAIAGNKDVAPSLRARAAQMTSMLPEADTATAAASDDAAAAPAAPQPETK